MQALQLKRGLFGYTPESVRLLLADRDKMFIRAAEQARAAEALVLGRRVAVMSAGLTPRMPKPARPSSRPRTG